VEEALKGDNPDHALAQLVSFASLLASKESYLEVVDQRPELIHRLNRFFSHSAYLSKTLMSSPFYLESVMEDELRTRSGASLTSELKILVEKHGESAAIRLLRRLKELRLGMLFVNRQLDVIGLTKALSRVADVIISSSLGRLAGQLTNEAPVAVVAFGKLGGREIIFNSDLDVVFVTSREPSPQDVRTAEQLLKSLMSYTKEGVAYKVDTRLRPEGSKGPLVNSVAGLAAYYARNAQPWELQALVKARPIAGDTSAARLFMEVRRRVLTQRGGEVTRADVKAMRQRISRELSKDAPRNGTYDVKLGRGCLEELEFSVQYLQLTRCRSEPALLVQATLDAVKRLGKAGIIGEADAARLRQTYLLYRSVETILRLREESVLREGSETLLQCASYLGLDPGDFIGVFKDMREWVSTFWSAL
jgi:glutamate-ammonia-ligase adenylyltransferase